MAEFKLSRHLKDRRRIVAVVFIIAVIFGLRVYLSGPDDGDILEGWGQGDITRPESNYYSRRIRRIIDFWKEHAYWESQQGNNERVSQPNDVFLVVDTVKPAIWVEYKGHVVEELYCELPEGMKWSINHVIPNQSPLLLEKVRLQVRGHCERLVFHELIHFIGQDKSRSLDFKIKSRYYQLYKGEVRYESIIVDESEYGRYLSDLKSRGAGNLDEEIVDSLFHCSEVFRANIKKWQAAEKRMYAEVYRRLTKKGYEYNHVWLNAGGDFLAGHARVGGYYESFFHKKFFKKFLKGKLYKLNQKVDMFLDCEYLGDNIWYFVSVDRLGPKKNVDRVEMEFLISADGKAVRGKRKWLAKGRKAMKREVIEPSKFRAKLDNGVEVELIGLCKNPSSANTWFAPDGSELGFVPYPNFKRLGRKEENRNIYEFVWRKTWPNIKSSSSGYKGKGIGSGWVENCNGVGARRAVDKYHWSIKDSNWELYWGALSFEEGQEKAAWKRGFKTRDGVEYREVRFENISLEPGKDMGVKVILEEESDESDGPIR